MTYFLDFDHTIFNTRDFYAYLAAIPALSAFKSTLEMIVAQNKGSRILKSEDRDALWNGVHKAYVEKQFAFDTAALESFVFTDARTFLEEHGNQVVVVTVGGVDPFFQKGKVEVCGVARMVSRYEVLPRGSRKGSTVASLKSSFEAPHYFVDDLPEEVASVLELAPGVMGFEMRRDGMPGSGVYPVIRDFTELPR